MPTSFETLKPILPVYLALLVAEIGAGLSVYAITAHASPDTERFRAAAKTLDEINDRLKKRGPVVKNELAAAQAIRNADLYAPFLEIPLQGVTPSVPLGELIERMHGVRFPVITVMPRPDTASRLATLDEWRHAGSSFVFVLGEIHQDLLAKAPSPHIRYGIDDDDKFRMEKLGNAEVVHEMLKNHVLPSDTNLLGQYVYYHARGKQFRSSTAVLDGWKKAPTRLALVTLRSPKALFNDLSLASHPLRELFDPDSPLQWAIDELPHGAESKSIQDLRIGL